MRYQYLIDVSKEFCKRTLATLDYVLIIAHGISGSGFWRENRPTFWRQASKDKSSIHIAFSDDARSAVDKFYVSALNAGGIDNGKPEIRPEYHPAYYGAFVKDLDGNNIETVCHLPE